MPGRYSDSPFRPCSKADFRAHVTRRRFLEFACSQTMSGLFVLCGGDAMSRCEEISISHAFRSLARSTSRLTKIFSAFINSAASLSRLLARSPQRGHYTCERRPHAGRPRDLARSVSCWRRGSLQKIHSHSCRKAVRPRNRISHEICRIFPARRCKWGFWSERWARTTGL